MSPLFNPEWLSNALDHISGLMAALERLPERPYVEDLGHARRELKAGHLQAALEHCAAIPWLRQDPGGLQGLQVYGSQHSLIDHHSRATALALARLSLESSGAHETGPALMRIAH